LGYFLLDIFFNFFFVRTIIITHIHAPKKDIISYHSAKKDMYTYPVFYPKSNLQFPTSSPIAGAHNNAAAAAATTTSKFRGWTYHFLEDIISYPYLGPQKGYYIQLLELTTWSHDDFG
jgi:hypothetical protein